MRWTLREAMRWAHCWGGLITGLLLMLIFLMGSLSVFEKEMNRWMMPDTRLPMVNEPIPLDKLLPPLVDQMLPGTAAKTIFTAQPVPAARPSLPAPPLQWLLVEMPDSRFPVMTLRLSDKTSERRLWLADPHSGKLLADQRTAGASFFYQLHYRLSVQTSSLGIWLVSFASMVMLLGLVSGIIIHARIFKDFFTFRTGKNPQRSLLDLHNLMGVLVLPFHFMITFSGLIIMFATTLPSVIQTLYPDGAGPLYQQMGYYSRPPARQAAPLASLDKMVTEARRIWGGDEVEYVFVHYPGDANAYVQIARAGRDRVYSDKELVFFDGVSGRVLQTIAHKPVAKVQRFISRLHVISFDGGVLRWLYFLGGLSGCALIATGMLYWIEKQRKQHERQSRLGLAVMAGITCAAVSGLLLATLAMLLANRLLPLAMDGRQSMEIGVFFVSWLLSAVHGFAVALRCRDGSAPWRSQCGLIATLALGAVLANALSTGDHLLRTIARGDWAVAGMDLVLIATAGIALSVVWWLAPQRGQGRCAVKVNAVRVNYVKAKEIRANAVKANEVKANAAKAKEIKADAVKLNGVKVNDIKVNDA